MRRYQALVSATGRSCHLVSTLLVTGAAYGQILQAYADSLLTYQAGATKSGHPAAAKHRGVGIDGSLLRAGPTFSMALAGNPFENAWTGREHQARCASTRGLVRLRGRHRAASAGISWVIGGTYSACRSRRELPSLRWAHGKELGVGKLARDRLLQRQQQRQGRPLPRLRRRPLRRVRPLRCELNQFKGRNGSAGVFDYVSGSPDTWVYTDQVGTRFTFLGFNTQNDMHDGQLWKIVDTANNKAYVGRPDSVSVRSRAVRWFGRVLNAYDTSDRRYTYTYTSSSYGRKPRSRA
jgi:hypothetical protein